MTMVIIIMRVKIPVLNRSHSLNHFFFFFHLVCSVVQLINNDCKDSDYSFNIFCRTAGGFGIQVQEEEEISVELIEERERAIRQLEVYEKENMHIPFVFP